MYENHFGLNRKPFQSATHDSEYFRSQAFEEVSSVVLHALSSDQGVAVLTGPSGCGKTAALEAIRRQLDGGSRTVLLRGGSLRTVPEFLQALSRGISREQQDPMSGQVQRWDVIERLERAVDFWGPLVLLVDDAHLLDRSVFAELRTFLEEEASGQKLIRLLIAGPLSLEETLAEPSMSDFALKIRTHGFLTSLRTEESVAYLDHQLTCAGSKIASIFEPLAVESIVTAADGLPRCLNLLTDEAMVVAAEHTCMKVMSAHVQEALSRLQHLPVTWNVVAMTESEEVENDSVNTVDSVVEIGGVSGSASQGSVIEIGAIEIGAIEIGGPPPVVELPQDEPHEIDADLEASIVAQLDNDVVADVIEVAGPADDDEPVFEFIEPGTDAEADPDTTDECFEFVGNEQDFDFVEQAGPSGSLTEFELWKPAGEWDTAAGVSEPAEEYVSPMDETLASLDLSSSEADEASIEPAVVSDSDLRPELAEIPAQLLTQPETSGSAIAGQFEAVSINDRFTALERGTQPVPEADGQTLVMQVADELQQILWPPQLEGVVPKDTITEISGQATDETEVVFAEAAADDSVEQDEHTLMLVHDGDAIPFDEVGVRSECDTQLTIDQIQEMLHSEIFECPSFGEETQLDESGRVFEWVSGSTIDELDQVADSVEFVEEAPVDEPLVAADPIPEITEPEQLYQPRLLAEAEERALRLVSDADDSESEFLFVQPRTESPASESVDVPPAAPGVTAPEQPLSESSRFADLFTRLRQMQKGA